MLKFDCMIALVILLLFGAAALTQFAYFIVGFDSVNFTDAFNNCSSESHSCLSISIRYFLMRLLSRWLSESTTDVKNIFSSLCTKGKISFLCSSLQTDFNWTTFVRDKQTRKEDNQYKKITVWS